MVISVLLIEYGAISITLLGCLGSPPESIFMINLLLSDCQRLERSSLFSGDINYRGMRSKDNPVFQSWILCLGTYCVVLF